MTEGLSNNRFVALSTSSWQNVHLQTLNITHSFTAFDFPFFEVPQNIRALLGFQQNINPNSIFHEHIESVRDNATHQSSVLGLYRYLFAKFDYDEIVRIVENEIYNLNIANQSYTVIPDMSFIRNRNTVVVTAAKTHLSIQRVLPQHTGQLLAEYVSLDTIEQRTVYGIILLSDQIYYTRMVINREIINFINANGLGIQRVGNPLICDIYEPINYGNIATGQVFENEDVRNGVLQSISNFKQFLINTLLN